MRNALIMLIRFINHFLDESTQLQFKEKYSEFLQLNNHVYMTLYRPTIMNNLDAKYILWAPGPVNFDVQNIDFTNINT